MLPLQSDSDCSLATPPRHQEVCKIEVTASWLRVQGFCAVVRPPNASEENLFGSFCLAHPIY